MKLKLTADLSTPATPIATLFIAIKIVNFLLVFIVMVTPQR